MDIDDDQPGLDDELTIKEAADMAGRSVKTLRRAIQDGLLPRRYSDGPFGPQLVCTRGDIERFLDNRAAQAVALGQTRSHSSGQDHARTVGSAPPADPTAFATALDGLQRAMDELRTAIQETRQRIAHLEEAAQRQEGGNVLGELTTRLARLEEQQQAEAASRLKDSGVREGLHARIEQLEATLGHAARRPLWKRQR